MKIMKIFIIITGLMELLVGSILVINPKLMGAYKKASNSLITTARMYGASAFSIGVFAIYVVINFQLETLHDPFLIVYSVFHFLVAFAIIISFYLNQTRDLKIAMLHGLFFVISVYFLLS